ncbi:MAG TPA: DUF4265 domain-containing protein [Mycobacterium sp.]|nr:DUF4265 domain-containing protein [Mycobacterium sp.]
MTEFEYRLQEGIDVEWAVTVSGFDDYGDVNRESVSHDTLVDVETTMERIEHRYGYDTGASLVRVHGAHGWREFEWSNDAVHRYEWSHVEVDLRCPGCGNADNAIYMVTDELWESSGLESFECFRCLEEAIGRQLVPFDFKRGIPANDGYHHGPELRQRIGGRAAKMDVPDNTAAKAQADVYIQHAAPIWRDRMNFVFDAALPDATNELEQLVGRQVADTEFELCCIPFFLYNVSLGDIVATNEDYLFERVVRPSGRFTFRVWFGKDSGAKNAPKDRVAAELELELGALLEWHGSSLLAVDAENGEVAQKVADYLQARETAGELTYETGRA